jgi:hypothetical protein
MKRVSDFNQTASSFLRSGNPGYRTLNSFPRTQPTGVNYECDRHTNNH